MVLCSFVKRCVHGMYGYTLPECERPEGEIKECRYIVEIVAMLLPKDVLKSVVRQT